MSDERGSKLTDTERKTLQLARSMLRDVAYGYATRELAADPRVVCERLSEILGERYDFDEGDVQEPS